MHPPDQLAAHTQEHKFGMFSFTTGTLEGKPVVYAFSNVGTVFSASAVSTRLVAPSPRAGRPL